MVNAPIFRNRRFLLGSAILGAGLLVSGCGQQYVVLHPQGPVGVQELNLMTLSAIAMAVVIAFVLVLFFLVVWRFRDIPGNRNPYLPNWAGNKRLEVLWFVIPAVILAIIGIPTVKTTYALAHLPKKSHPVVIDVTSLDWKWLFQYPKQKIATVNYVVIPTNRPVLFELTADSPMNTFWVPQLGGMEYTMPGRILPLWLQADKAGTYWGRSGNFSGAGFSQMLFHVKAISDSAFSQWTNTVKQTHVPMTLADYHQLLHFNSVGDATYSTYPPHTFPSATHGFSLTGGMYLPTSSKTEKP